jgi:hypothetical protein
MKITTLVVALAFGLFPTTTMAKGKLNAPKEVTLLMPSCLGFLDSKFGLGINLSKYGYKQRRRSAKSQKFRKILNRGWNRTEASFSINFEKGNKDLRFCQFSFEYADRLTATSASTLASALVLKYIKNEGYKLVKTPSSGAGKFFFRRGDDTLKYSATLVNGYTFNINLSKN